MSSALADLPIGALDWDRSRGSRSMGLFIATEAALFVVLFFSYFYLSAVSEPWPTDGPPKLRLAFVMLAVLLSSSGVVYLAERWAAAGRIGLARFALVSAAAMGCAFLVIQGFEYADRLHSLRPTDDAYGSIFFTITSIHGLHVLLGLTMLVYAAALPHPEHSDKPPHRALHNAALYWHFVDAVWVLIVAALYLLPHAREAFA